MVVCHCKALNETAIRSAIAAADRVGVRVETVDMVGARCGAGTDCGSCHDAIRCLLESVSDRSGQAVTIAA